MTTQEPKSNGPAVLSTALLERIDELAQWFTDNPNRDDIKDGLCVLVRDVAFIEREACKQLADNCAAHCAEHENPYGANAAEDISCRIAERSNAGVDHE